MRQDKTTPIRQCYGMKAVVYLVARLREATDDNRQSHHNSLSIKDRRSRARPLPVCPCANPTLRGPHPFAPAEPRPLLLNLLERNKTSCLLAT